MGTRSWDGIPVTSIDDQATSTAHRVLLERLVDELDQLSRIVWSDAKFNRPQLRDQVDEAMMISCTLLDLVHPAERTTNGFLDGD